MSAHGCSFDQLGDIEPTFVADAPWRGHFELDGLEIQCALYSDGWIRLSVPVAGVAAELVLRQGRLLLPVKIVAGPSLVAEMPLTDDLASTFLTLRSVAHQGLAWSESAESGIADDDLDGAGAARFEPVLEESGLDWQRHGKHLVTRVGTIRIVAAANGTSAVFRAGVARLNPIAGPPLDALADFILAVNARFSFVRGTFLPDRVVEEVAIPMAVLTPALVNRAAGAISDAVRLTKRACTALVDGQVAEQYLEFHKQRRDAHADAHA